MTELPTTELVVVNRFRVADHDAGAFREDAHRALAVLSIMPGYVGGHVGRNVDEPDLWLLASTWRDVGSYRRALSSYDVKVTAVPLLSRAIDESSAYETTQPGGVENLQRPRSLD
jgi:quinol monooxygenase YgiN